MLVSSYFAEPPNLRALLIIVCALLTANVGHSAPRPPNIVLIMADDMGYECVGANGGTSYATPQLDALARGGMRFQHCYSQPICTPSRVQLMTGIYNQRNYIRFGLLDPSATTFAQVLKKAGYKTCIGGKWQLGGGLEAPEHFGFDDYCLWQIDLRRSRYPNPVLERNGEVIRYRSGEYGPDIVADHLVSFIRQNRDSPFLVYYPMILPHWPFEPTPDSDDWNPKAEGVLKGQGKPRYFGDMVTYTDKMVGKLVRALDDLDLRENTLILFTGDNGTATSIRSKMGDVVIPGGKGKTTDGGTHVPFIASWPGVIPAGKTCDDLIDFSDFFPTLAEAASARVPAGLRLDGHSFLPQLRGKKGTPREWTYCWYARNGGPKGAEFVRDHRYKLYRDGRFFDVSKDRFEKKDLSKKLDPPASKSHEKLSKALERFRDTRKTFPKKRKTKKQGEKKTSAQLESEAAKAIRAVGGVVFLKGRRPGEVNLNRQKFGDDLLRHVGALSELTDISLEETAVTDTGIANLAKLEKVEWLNLYRTKIGDNSLKILGGVSSLTHLPVGGTQVTDEGLAHLSSLKRLEYLGLRGNVITDAGLVSVAKISSLTELHLGETRVTSAGLVHLARLQKLEKLWLSSTGIGDDAIESLTRLRTLRELHLDGTRISERGLAVIRKALPSCKVR